MELLTLQQTCLLFIVLHLDEIPTATLRLLPVRLRCEILNALQPCDIWRLERTPFVEGLHTNLVWCHIYEKCSLKQIAQALCRCTQRRGTTVRSSTTSNCAKYPCICQAPHEIQEEVGENHSVATGHLEGSRVCDNSLPCQPNSTQQLLSWRECVINIICSLILSNAKVGTQHFGVKQPCEIRFKQSFLHSLYVALQIIFGGHIKITQDDVSSRKRFTFNSLAIKYGPHYAVPTRINRLLQRLEDSLKQKTHLHVLISTLVTECEIFPTNLCINDAPVTDESQSHQQLWTEYNSTHLLRQFLSRVENLKLCYRDAIPKFSCGYFVTECVTKLPESNLESFVIVINERTTQSRGHPQMCKTLLTSLAPLLSSNLENGGGIGYSNLTNFQVLSNYRVESSKFNNAVATKGLMQVSANQKRLESLVVAGCWGFQLKMGMHVLTDFCHSLLLSSHLRFIYLRDLDISLSLVQLFLRLFLHSQAPHEQVFVLQSVWMHETSIGCDLDGLVEIPDNPYHIVGDVRKKSLHFLSMHIPNSFLVWLSTLPVLMLKDLQLSDIQYDPDMLPGGMIGAIANHRHSFVENVSVSCHTTDCPSEMLDVLLEKSDTLQSLTLVEPKPNLIRILISGLNALKHHPKSTLHHLTVKKAHFEHDQLCQDFVDSLLGLSDLLVTLTDTRMSSDYKCMFERLPNTVIL